MTAQTWMLAALAVPALGALLIALAGRAPALRAVSYTHLIPSP